MSTNLSVSVTKISTIKAGVRLILYKNKHLKNLMTDKVKLLCNDGEVVEVAQNVAEKSVLIKGLIEDSGIEEEIPLPQVKKQILEKIIVFCERLLDHQPPEIDKPLSHSDMA